MGEYLLAFLITMLVAVFTAFISVMLINVPALLFAVPPFCVVYFLVLRRIQRDD